MKRIVVKLLVFFFLVPQFVAAQAIKPEGVQQGNNGKNERKEATKQYQLQYQVQSSSPSAMPEDFEKKVLQIRQQTQINSKVKEANFKKALRNNKSLTKIEAAEKITTNFKDINTMRTDQMARVITQLEEVLIKIKTRRDTVAAAGTEMTTIDASIASAEAALTSVKTMVTAQAQKDYIPAATDEAYLKYSLGTTMKQLQSDLQAVHKALMDAKQALYAAATALRSGSKSVTGSPVSVTPTIVPTVAPTISEKINDTTDAELDDLSPMPLP